MFLMKNNILKIQFQFLNQNLKTPLEKFGQNETEKSEFFIFYFSKKCYQNLV